jgi:hypothetical protein
MVSNGRSVETMPPPVLVLLSYSSHRRSTGVLSIRGFVTVSARTLEYDPVAEGYKSYCTYVILLV